MKSSQLKLLPFIRVSTEEQRGENGEGVQRQYDAIRSIAERHGAELLPPFEFIDVSGSSVHLTPEWRRVLAVVAEPNTHIVIDDIDRLLRAENFDFRVMQDLLALRTYVYTPTVVYDLALPEQGFQAALLALLAGREKQEIKRRIMAGREAARRRGGWPLRDSALPRGLAYDRNSKRWSYTEDAEVVRYCFNAFVVEGKPLHAIGRAIGKSMQTVSLYLANPIYKGWLVWDKRRGEPYKRNDGKQPDRKKVRRPEGEIVRAQVFGKDGQDPPLVSEAVWHAAQERKRQNSEWMRRARDEGRPDGWASGFLHSADVSFAQELNSGFGDLPPADENPLRHVIYLNGGGLTENNPRRYSCTCCRLQARATGLSKCNFPTPVAAKLNANLDRYLTMVTQSSVVIAEMKAILNAEVTAPQAQVDTCTAAIEQVDKKLSRLRRLYVVGDLDETSYDAERDKLRQQKLTLEQQRDSQIVQKLRPTVASVEAMATEWAWHADWPPATKRAWLQKHIVSIGLDRDRIRWCLLQVPSPEPSESFRYIGGEWAYEIPLFIRAPRATQHAAC